jgi:hypothetical protein
MPQEYSQHRKRLTKDVHFSMDIGRESNFDPSQSRDLSTLHGKMAAGSNLMYFAQKPMRRSQMPVNFAKMPDPRKMVYEREISQKLDEGTLPDNSVSVSFTKAQRFRPDSSMSAQGVRSASRASAVLSAVRKQRGADDTQSVSSTATRRTDTIVVKPDCSRAPNIGRGSDREGRRPPSRVASTPPSRRYMLLPWEIKEHGRDAPSPAPSPKAGDSTMLHQSKKSDVLESPLSPQQAAEEDDEEWRRKRKQTVARYGLLNGGGKDRHRRRQRTKGVEFGSQSSRTDWNGMGWQPRPKETNDILYGVKDHAPGQKYAVASTNLGKQAPRAFNKESTQLYSAAQKILQVDSLSEFHQKLLRTERRANVGLPQPDGTQSQALRRPLTAADEFDFNRDSHRAPCSVLTRNLRGTPDMTLFCDRVEEPLTSVLGGWQDKARFKRGMRDEARQTASPQ